jgi:Mg2+ and Co2+ transporter CorA
MAVMPMPREKWTDERLDDLSKKVDDGFAEVKNEMRDRFDRLEAQISRMEQHRLEDIRRIEKSSTEGYDRMSERFHALNMTLIGGFFLMIAALIGGNGHPRRGRDLLGG